MQRENLINVTSSTSLKCLSAVMISVLEINHSHLIAKRDSMVADTVLQMIRKSAIKTISMVLILSLSTIENKQRF